MLSSENSPQYHLLVVLYNAPMPKWTFQFASHLVDSKFLPAWGNRPWSNTLLLGCTHHRNKWYLIIPIHVYHQLFLSLTNTESCRPTNFALRILGLFTRCFFPLPGKTRFTLRNAMGVTLVEETEHAFLTGKKTELHWEVKATSPVKNK